MWTSLVLVVTHHSYYEDNHLQHYQYYTFCVNRHILFLQVHY